MLLILLLSFAHAQSVDLGPTASSTGSLILPLIVSNGGTGTSTAGTGGEIPYTNNTGVFQYNSGLSYTPADGLYVQVSGTTGIQLNSPVKTSFQFMLAGNTLGFYATAQANDDWVTGSMANDLVLRMPNSGNCLNYTMDGGNTIVQRSCGTQIFYQYGITVNTAVSQPTCASANRGQEWIIQGGDGVADVFQICQKNAADAYAWATH